MTESSERWPLRKNMSASRLTILLSYWRVYPAQPMVSRNRFLESTENVRFQSRTFACPRTYSYGLFAPSQPLTILTIHRHLLL